MTPPPVKVLVVDDEAAVGSLICKVLQRRGFRALQALSGAEALELAADNDVRLVITDVDMPGLRGPELVSRLMEQGCHAHYLLVSGYLPNQDEISGLPFLPKPFTSSQLMEAIEQIMAASAAEVQQAKDEWLAAIAEMDAIRLEGPGSIPHPDGTERIARAGRRRKAAFEKYRAAAMRQFPPPEEDVWANLQDPTVG
jgi:CheY-like chemotaxis protein